MLHFLPNSTLFTLSVSSAAVGLGLTAYLMIAGSHVRGASLQFLFLLDALWTLLFLPACVLWFERRSLDILANLFGSILWIFAAAIVWGAAIAFVHNTRARKSCTGIPSDLRCTHHVSPRFLAWVEFALCVVTSVLAITWVRGSRVGRSKQHPRFYV